VDPAGALLPTTFSGRKWLTFHSDHVPWQASAQFLSGFLPAFMRGQDPDGGGVAFAAIGLATLAGILLAVRRRQWRMLILAFLAAYMLLVYAVLMPSYSHGLRYVAMPLLVSAVFASYGCVGWLAVAGARLKRGRALPALCGLALCTYVAVASLQAWTAIGRAGIGHIAATHVRMGRWLAANLPADATVASFDIGAIAWFSGLHVIDLGGLTDPGFTPYLFTGRAAEYLRARHAGWLVLPSEQPAWRSSAACTDALERQLALCDGRALRKRPEILFASPTAIWRLGHERTGHAMQA
jgi:hypothetical protein